MLTVKECAALVNGLSEHTVRQLVAQGKIAYVRAGSGVRGKILVSKASLLKYLGVADLTQKIDPAEDGRENRVNAFF